MISDSFLTYRNFRWLWLSLLLVAICVGVYLSTDRVEIPNGGTTQGYLLGIIATVLILVLMWFGIRKRSFNARFTTLTGCLAAHVWLGLAVCIIVPLHSGFQFGMNVHTLAYALIVLTVVTGLIGMIIYVRYPKRVMSHRGAGSLKSLVEKIEELSLKIQFLSRNRSDEFLYFVDELDKRYEPSILNALLRRAPKNVSSSETAKLLASLPFEEQDEGREVTALVREKRRLIRQIEADIRILVLFRSWLYFHVPLSVGTLGATGAHILAVMAYR
jgi:hypothetical protein